jgi:hypothetical protein
MFQFRLIDSCWRLFSQTNRQAIHPILQSNRKQKQKKTFGQKEYQRHAAWYISASKAGSGPSSPHPFTL